ncbi:MAG: S8 family serine peptidase, partial [candidate division WOR-3 bacterium]
MLSLILALVSQGRFIVHFSSASDMQMALPALAEKAQVIKTVSRALNFAVVITEDPDALRGLPGVILVEPDGQVYSLYTPNDSIWPQQWGPPNIHCPEAWDLTFGDSAVRVGVLDEGIDYLHPDLAPHFGSNPGYDFVDEDPDPAPDWGLYHEIHGQHVAGILAAVTGNGIYMAGVAMCHLYALRVLDSMGVGWNSDIAEAILWAADSGLHVINMSLGGTSSSAVLRDACDTAFARGVLLLAASGNNGANYILYPAAYESVIAVGATDSTNNLWGNSNYGDEQELVAPGVDIISIMPYGNLFYGEYLTVSGTSMACPHAAGVAALVKAQFPGMTNSDIRQRLRETSVDLGDPGWDMYYGYGKVDAYRALVGVEELAGKPGVSMISGPTVVSGPAEFGYSGPGISLFDPSGRRIAGLSRKGDRFFLDPD